MARSPKSAETIRKVAEQLASGSSPFAIRATSSRAPYTRGGLHFASRREPVVLPETTTPDQVRRLVADTAITLSLVHLDSGRFAELPREIFDADGLPDPERVVELSDALLTAAPAPETASAEKGEAA